MNEAAYCFLLRGLLLWSTHINIQTTHTHTPKESGGKTGVDKQRQRDKKNTQRLEGERERGRKRCTQRERERRVKGRDRDREIDKQTKGDGKEEGKETYNSPNTKINTFYSYLQLSFNTQNISPKNFV